MTEARKVVTVFRSRLRDDAGEEYVQEAERMLDLAKAMPGFLSFKQFTSDDRERVSVIEFDSLEHEQAWRDHLDHRKAQQRGREAFYTGYVIQVCEVLRERSFGAAL